MMGEKVAIWMTNVNAKEQNQNSNTKADFSVKHMKVSHI